MSPRRASGGRALSTTGPCHLFRHAIRADGGPEDINWVALMGPKIGQHETYEGVSEVQREIWTAPMITIGAALNFLNASNVDIATPARPRPLRRRIERTGVDVQTIVVRPPGKRRISTGQARPISAGESVLAPRRGHWARYGVEGRERLLFGRYAGKFWIPAVVGGSRSGVPVDYVLKPGRATRRTV